MNPEITTYVDGTLGGCSHGGNGDPQSWEPALWTFLLDTYGVESVLDVGCGFGYSTRWFHDHGLRTLGIEGSAEIARNSGLDCVRVHDFTMGPIRDLDEYDLCWCSEFLEHVDSEFEPNIFAAFRHCQTLAITAAAPGQAGYQHINCRQVSYWVDQITSLGFWFDRTMTGFARELATEAHRYSYFGYRGLLFHAR